MMANRQCTARVLTCGFVLLLLGGLPGCAMWKQLTTAPPEPVKPSVGKQTLLAAARNNEITLFGDLPGTGGAQYRTRTAVGLKQHTFSVDGSDFDPDLDAKSGRVVFASTRHHLEPDLYMKSADGVAVTQLTADPAADIQPAFSPDGQRVAFTSNRSGNWDLWVIDLQVGRPVQITDTLSDEIHPTWSPDGKRLVYSRLAPYGGQWELWVSDAKSGGRDFFVGFGLFPEWSPNSDTILYQRARERGSHRFSIWTLELINGEPQFPVEVAAGTPDQAFIQPTWSVDGSLIVFTSVPVPRALTPGPAGEPMPAEVLAQAAQPSDIWLMAASGEGRVCLTDGYASNFGPCLGRGGRVFFTSDRGGTETIWSMQPSRGQLAGAMFDTTLGHTEARALPEPGAPETDAQASGGAQAMAGEQPAMPIRRAADVNP
jgi:TolB protein